jgi:hypothetical protein
VLLRPALRRAIAALLLLVAGAALFIAIQELGPARPGGRQGLAAFVALLGVAAGSVWGAARVGRPPRSRAAVTGHVVLWETPMPGTPLGHTPALTIRGPRDAVERFIPRAEFDDLFGGWALWGAPAHPTPEMPDQALGVWSRRTCARFRRILRERGATLDVRREAGPVQPIVQFSVRRTRG